MPPQLPDTDQTPAALSVNIRSVSRRRRFIVVTIAGATLVAVVAGALLLKVDKAARPVYLQEPGFELTGHRYVHDPVTGWRNIPNWRATTFGQPLSINSQGLRDREYDLQKAAGTLRILVLGDSYTWGYGVADDEVFTEVLERNMTTDGRACDVINTGVSGWGTDQEYLFLKHEGFQYSPDVVVLAFFLANDPTNNFYNRQYGLWKPLFINQSLELTNSPVPLPHERVRIRTAATEMYSLTAAIVSQIASDCAAHGTELIVMKFGVFLEPQNPVLLSADENMTAAFQKIPELRVLDLDVAFSDRDISVSQLTAGNHDMHWNAFGHTHTAIILEEFLKENELHNSRKSW